MLSAGFVRRPCRKASSILRRSSSTYERKRYLLSDGRPFFPPLLLRKERARLRGSHGHIPHRLLRRRPPLRGCGERAWGGVSCSSRGPCPEVLPRRLPWSDFRGEDRTWPGRRGCPLWEHALREGQEIRLEYNWFIGVLAFYENLEGGDPCVVLVRDTILFQGFSFHDLPQGEPGECLQEEWKEALLSPVPSGGMNI